MYSATCEVLCIINGQNPINKKVDAETAYEDLASIEFVFILHIMRAILEISDRLSQALQLQAQDILNAMSLISTTKPTMQKLRDDGWEPIVKDVRNFCEKISPEFSDLTVKHVPRRRQPRRKKMMIL